MEFEVWIGLSELSQLAKSIVHRVLLSSDLARIYGELEVMYDRF